MSGGWPGVLFSCSPLFPGLRCRSGRQQHTYSECAHFAAIGMRHGAAFRPARHSAAMSTSQSRHSLSSHTPVEVLPPWPAPPCKSPCSFSWAAGLVSHSSAGTAKHQGLLCAWLQPISMMAHARTGSGAASDPPVLFHTCHPLPHIRPHVRSATITAASRTTS